MHGALHFFAEIPCPNCGATAKVRPPRFTDEQLQAMVAGAAEWIEEDEADWAERCARPKRALERE
jgi:hypothetical protein